MAPILATRAPSSTPLYPRKTRKRPIGNEYRGLLDYSAVNDGFSNRSELWMRLTLAWVEALEGKFDTGEALEGDVDAENGATDLNSLRLSPCRSLRLCTL
jgi:hypothetical protein